MREVDKLAQVFLDYDMMLTANCSALCFDKVDSEAYIEAMNKFGSTDLNS
jgi:hypothetical protein